MPIKLCPYCAGRHLSKLLGESRIVAAFSAYLTPNDWLRLFSANNALNAVGKSDRPWKTLCRMLDKNAELGKLTGSRGAKEPVDSWKLSYRLSSDCLPESRMSGRFRCTKVFRTDEKTWLIPERKLPKKAELDRCFSVWLTYKKKRISLCRISVLKRDGTAELCLRRVPEFDATPEGWQEKAIELLNAQSDWKFLL